MAAQVERNHAIFARQNRNPLEPTPRVTHCRVQQQQGIWLAPGVGEVINLIGKLQAIPGAETIHNDSFGVNRYVLLRPHALVDMLSYVYRVAAPIVQPAVGPRSHRHCVKLTIT